jgi:primosomal protein N' (replication factor Y)
MATASAPMVVRVLPDVPAIRREFDYLVPPSWIDDGRAANLDVGSMVRVELHGRRVAGWVTEINPGDRHVDGLRELAKISGVGPSAELIDLCRWAAHRWVGPVSSMLKTASPPKMVARVVAPRPSSPQPPPDVDLVRDAFQRSGAAVRLPALGDRWPFVLGAVAQGNALILVPSLALARTLVGRLRKRGVVVGLYPRDWAYGASGATIVGARAAAFAPVEDLAAVLVIDEHDEVYQEERAPTWNARDVVIERARRAGVPCVLTSPLPTLEAQAKFPLLRPSRQEERSGWPLVRVVDPREDGSARGTLWSESVVRLLQEGGRVAIVLNRKGRSKLLACVNCDELVVCDICDASMRQDEDHEFVCTAEGHRRPVVCASCGATTFKNLRIGVTRAREELEALLREPVIEVTGDTDDEHLADGRVFVGTEAVLHRVDAVGSVAFVDFDQELVAPRYRASEEALAMLVRAGRLVGGRREGTGQILIQTRLPSHPVIQAAMAADIEPWSIVEATRRELLRYPPFAALAEVSGAAAPAFVESLGSPLDLEIRGPVDNRWLIRATDHQTLANSLGAVERPKGRLRIAVDPLRLS